MKNIKKISSKKWKIVPVLFTFFLTIVSFSSANWLNLTEATTDIKSIIDSLQVFLTILVITLFFYIVVKFIIGKKDGGEEKINLSWAVIGLFVFMTLWGIVAFLQSSTFGNNGQGFNDVVPGVTIEGY